MANKKILIIDDEPDIVALMKGRLEQSGFEVITSSDGSDRLIKARTEKPDLIFLDLMLPKLDGFQVSRMLKFDQKYKDIPMKLLSLTQSTAERKIFLDLGLQGNYENILGFLNSFEDANSFLYIDTADISSQRKGIALTLKIICAYK